jgi:hypothetical protein
MDGSLRCTAGDSWRPMCRGAHRKWNDVCFPDRAKQEVSLGASKDGFTAIRKSNPLHALSRVSRPMRGSILSSFAH